MASPLFVNSSGNTGSKTGPVARSNACFRTLCSLTDIARPGVTAQLLKCLRGDLAAGPPTSDCTVGSQCSPQGECVAAFAKGGEWMLPKTPSRLMRFHPETSLLLTIP